MDDKSLSSLLPGNDDPVDVMLFMPEATFNEMHGHATRLGITDTALFTGCWLAARSRIRTDPACPRLVSRANGAAYLSLAAAVRDDAHVFAESQNRSMSWVFVKAWDMARAEVVTLSNEEQFSAWVRHRQQSSATPV